MTIGESIRKHRKAKRVLQKELAESIGVHQVQISWWETGRTFPNILNCISLADALQITIDELVGRNKK